MRMLELIVRSLMGIILCLSMAIVIAIMVYFLKVILDEIFGGDAIDMIVRWIRDKKDIHEKE